MCNNDFRASVKSDDDCVIVSPLDKKARIQYDIIPIPGNMHCITPCFSSYFKKPLDKVLDHLDEELCKNLEMYDCFSDLKKGKNKY